MAIPSWFPGQTVVGQSAFQQCQNLLLGHVADGLVHGLAVLDDNQGGDAGDAELHGQFHLAVHIHLADDHILSLLGDLGQQGGDQLAGTSPHGPEVQQDQIVLSSDGGKIVFRNGNNGHKILSFAYHR